MNDDPHQPAAPFLLELAPGDYRWCACGRSRTPPFCDDSHADTDVRPLHFRIVGKPRLVWLCACRRSRSAPHCDGSHNRRPQSDCRS